MSADRWRTGTLVAAVFVGLVLLLRVCRYVTHANRAFDTHIIESIDPDDLCWKRCQGPWSSYTRDADGEDHCACVGRAR